MKDQKEKAFLHMPPMKELSTEEARQNPFPILKQLREQTPVRFDTDRQLWDVFRYEDVANILRDGARFSTNLNYAGAMNNQESLMSATPSRHRQIRELLDKAFTPKEVQQLAPRIRDIATELLNSVVNQNEMQTVRDYAGPLPVIVIAEMLGVPAQDRAQFKEWSDAMLTGVYDDSEASYQMVVQRQQQARYELFGYFKQILEQRKVNPQDDLISKVWHSNLEENVLSEQGMLGFFIGLLVAGNETTTNLISAAVRILCEQPELQAQLQNDRSQIPAFVEEVLRFYPPSSMLPRLAIEDVELHGQQIKAGDMIHVWIMSANRDAIKFEQPEEFRLDRGNNQHLTFGFGMHFCLGAPLARLEAQIAVESLLDRIGNLKRTNNEKLELLPLPMFTSVKEYPVTFTAVQAD